LGSPWPKRSSDPAPTRSRRSPIEVRWSLVRRMPFLSRRGFSMGTPEN